MLCCCQARQRRCRSTPGARPTDCRAEGPLHQCAPRAHAGRHQSALTPAAGGCSWPLTTLPGTVEDWPIAVPPAWSQQLPHDGVARRQPHPAPPPPQVVQRDEKEEGKEGVKECLHAGALKGTGAGIQAGSATAGRSVDECTPCATVSGHPARLLVAVHAPAAPRNGVLRLQPAPRSGVCP
jgi:hypothetical protein